MLRCMRIQYTLERKAPIGSALLNPPRLEPTAEVRVLRLRDMCRTVLNVTGDLAIATCVNRAETRHHRAAVEERAVV